MKLGDTELKLHFSDPLGVGPLVDEEAESWLPTKYRENCCQKLRGVDCVRFGSAVLDALFGSNQTSKIRKMKGDTSLHSRKAVFSALKDALRLFPHVKVRGSQVQPGDVLVTGPEHGGPGHLMIVGGKQGILWHSTSPSGVSRAGYSLNPYDRLFAIFRPLNRESWHARRSQHSLPCRTDRSSVGRSSCTADSEEA